MIANINIVYDGVEISYELSAGIDCEKDYKKYMCSLSFVKDLGTMSEKYIGIWDNEEYLMETLYKKVLVPWVESKDIPYSDDFAGLLKMKGVKLEDFEGLIELFKHAIILGFFEELYKNCENGQNNN